MKTSFYLQRRLSAFSLVEVVVAVGIFAISIVGVIGLLGPTNKSVADVRDTDDATRVVTAIQAQLQTLAQTSAGWTTLTGTYLRSTTQVQNDDLLATFDPYTKAYILFASRDGSRIGVAGVTVWPGETQANSPLKYFEIELIRNGDSPAVGNGLSPAANDTTAGFLAYVIRLRWPAYLPNGQRFTDNTQNNVLLVPGAVHR